MTSYHVELRSFPRTSTRFNQSGTAVGAIVLPWVQDQVFELDGEKWTPYDSQLTIIEGSEIPVAGLSMGRGWATAQREGTDVTNRVLGEARRAIADGSAYATMAAAGEVSSADEREGEPKPAQDYPSLAGGQAPAASVQPLDVGAAGAMLGEDPQTLLRAWLAVASRTAGLAPSESLALAERELQRGGRSED